MRYANDDDTWQPLGLATARLLQRLEEQRPESEREKTQDSEIEKQREHERFVETQLREIERFERRYLRDRTRG